MIVLVKRVCLTCPDSVAHETGSQIWISCKWQVGWRDINSVCNLEESNFFVKDGVVYYRRVEQNGRFDS